MKYSVSTKPTEAEGLPKKEADVSGVRTRVDYSAQFGLRVIKEVSIGTSVSFKDPEHGSETEIIVDKNGNAISIVAKKPLKGFYSWQGEGPIPEEYRPMIDSLDEIVTGSQEKNRLADYLRHLTQNVIRLP